MKKTTFLLLLSLASLTACQDNATAPSVAKNNNQADFVGCYSVEKGKPAQIKIDKAGEQYTMQMKENNDKIWDNAEPLDSLTVADGYAFFSANALSLKQSDVTAIIARPDKVMAMASLNSAVANVNPQIDSDVVMSLFGAVNTVYRVECDSTPLELVPKGDIHGIGIESKGK